MKNLIYGSALMMIMTLAANSFAAPKTYNGNGEKSKTEVKSNSDKKGDMKKGEGKASCCQHNKKSCKKK